LFVLSTVFFAIASWCAGDTVVFIWAMAFLAANISFMIPVYHSGDKD